jgi:hypothetical protein
MLESTRRDLAEINEITFKAALPLKSDEPLRQTLLRISHIAETALAEERAHEKAQLLAINNPENAEAN